MIVCRVTGAVIGRGGEMITRLQAESGARIQVAPGLCVCVWGGNNSN